MSQFGGGSKIPPPWQQQRPVQATPQLGSLLGQPPQPPQIVQQPQYAPVQQSMIQPPGLGGLQSLGQPNMGAASMTQPTLGAAQASNVSMAAASIMGQPPVSSVTVAAMQPPNLVNPTQLINTVAPIQQQIQQQVSSVAYPAPRTMAQVTTVSYPTPRALAPQGFNPAATPSNLNPALAATGIPNVTNANIPGTNSTSGQQPQKQRVFTGTITKLCADFGFVDEDVFFQTSCVKGPKPSVNDRVLVEASYNPNMPFKWNANRVQVIPGPQSAPSVNPPRTAPSREPQGRSGSYNAVPPPNFSSESGSGTLAPRSSAGTARSRSPRRVHRDRDRSRERERTRNEKDRDEKRENRKRSRSRSRGRSPPRRRPRVLPRYNVQVPKIMLHMKEANVPELRKRYSNLYVPSDVFLARPLWSNTFQAHKPFHFPQPVSFHIMNKEVDPILDNDAIYDAPDANHNFAAKVMLMAVPALQDIYRRACALSEDPSDVRDCFVHPTRLINFLVGLKGKNETMAIGGYWSPSLDGPNPEKDPQVLINTAIRTCRALTGIDLSPCTTWYRFAEIYYRRGGSSSRSTNSSGSSNSSGSTARVETTVLFLPDVWNVCPTKLEWDGLHLNYKRQLDKRLLAAGGGAAAATTSDAAANSSANNLQISQPEQDEEEWEEEALKKRDPTNWAELDPKTMKVVELRGELDARLMNSKGLKSQLIARLTKVLKTEQEKEEAEALANAELMKKDENRMKEEEEKKREEEKRRREEDEKKKDEEEKKKAEERERTIMEKRYTLPEQPMIVVHPSRTAKSGKFDCTTMSLSVLLDYRQEDNKEHSFEVSLFAELFNEMLMRDFAFRIYRALVESPEKKEEKKDKDKDKKKDEKDKDEKDKDRDRDKDKEKDKEKEDKKEKYKDDKEEVTKKDKDDKEKLDDKDKKDDKDDKKAKDDIDDKKNKDDHKKEDDEKKDDDEEDEEMEEDDDEEVDDEDSKDTRNSGGRSKDRDKDRKRSSDDKKDRREKKEKKKMVTIDPFLLLAFVYFDQTHTGYIIDRDLEDIINMLGLNLSRAQQKKLMTKVISRDVLYYRKMTDVEEKEREKPRESNPVTELESLALGNNGLLPTFMDQLIDAAAKSSNKKDKLGVKDEVAVSATTMISYEGTIISIGKLMQQLERSQKARTDTEDKLRQLQKELEQSKEEAKNSTEKSQKLSREVRSANSNIKTLEEELQKVSEDNTVYQRALNGVRDVIKPLVTDLEYMDDTDIEMKPSISAGTTEVKMEGDDKPMENGTSQTK